MAHPVQLLSVATAVPPHVMRQQDVVAAARDMFGSRFAAFERLSKVFATAGIEQRHAVRPIAWFATPRGWPERTEAYLEGAGALFIEAATLALDRAGLKARDIDTVVTVSSTGISTPSLEARAATAMGFRDDVQRVPVFGLGCAGGVSGFALAARLAKATPGSRVLLVVIELCSLAFRLDQLTKANIVATALFGDGAAACVLSAQAEGLAEVEAAGERLWPDTLDIMGWTVDPEGFGVIFAQAIPPFAERHMGPAVTSILAAANLTLADMDRFICHPGGAKVIVALETALHLTQGSLVDERAVLAGHGNMSAPTVLFVLERAVKSGLPGRSAMMAMGPGFCASAVVLKAAA